MRLRSGSFLLTACLAAAVPLSAVSAAPVCKIVEDAAGDAGTTGTGAPGDGSLDIVSADIASDAKTITAAIRLGDLVANNAQSPLGQGFFLRWNIKGAPEQLFLSARVYPYQTKYVFGYSAVDPNTGLNTSYTIGDATGVFDVDKSEVRVSAPVAGFEPAKAKMPKGAKLTGVIVDTWVVAGQGLVPSQDVGGQRVPLGGFLLREDDAEGKSYVVGTASCVAVGK